MTRQPRIFVGGLHRDIRGEVRYVNEFGFQGVDRFYTVHPSGVGELRGWVGHRRDRKWFSVPKGAIRIGVAQPKGWAPVSREAAVQAFLLTADAPAVLEVPPGFFTASVALQPDSILTVFSSGAIETAGTDDFRVSSDYWSLPAE